MRAVAFILCFALGVAAGTLGLGMAASLLFLLIALAAYTYIRFVERLGSGSALFVLPLAMLAIALGIARVALMPSPSTQLDAHIGSEAEMVGVVVREPDVRESRVRLVVRAESVAIAGAEVELSEDVLASVPLLPEFEYGDRVKITGRIAKPESFETENGRMFDYGKYLEKDGIYHEMEFANAELVGRGEGSIVKRVLFGAKRRFVAAVGRVVPEPESSLLSGILLGGKSSLGEGINDDFRKAGLAHIVVLSGYNIAIVAAVLMRALAFMPRRIGLAAGALGIALFVVMAGAGASAARAGTMALLVLAARAGERRYDALRGLLVAGLVMVLHNPLILLYDPSFQLSFMATLSLVTMSPLMEARLGFLTERWHLREIAIATVATQVFMLPLVLYLMGTVSLVALPVNILVLPVMPAAMLSGFITGTVALLSDALALVPGFITHALLAFVLLAARLAASVPYASVSVGAFPLSATLVSYAVYAVIIWKMRRATSKGRADGAPNEFDTSMAFEIVN